MLTVIIILLIFNTLLNLSVGFLIIVALGEFGSLNKFRIEFGDVVRSDDADTGGNKMQNAI